jgi:choline dehydrogenase-like flavoprotein
MIADFTTNVPENTDGWDVLIIGAGTAGLVAGKRFSDRGKRVCLLESGGLHQIEDTHPFNEVVQLDSPYSGAEHGRFRCLGGTSTRWGGAMLPFMPWDLDRPDTGWNNTDWPVSLEAFTTYRKDLEHLFGLPDDAYEYPEMFIKSDGKPNNFIARLAKWPPFKLRNVATLFDEWLKSDRVNVWLNATVTRFTMAPEGRLLSVTVSHLNGKTAHFKALQIVIAAGAIESTRLLALMDQQNDKRLFTPDDVLGRYFHDHLSTETARLKVYDQIRLNRITGFRFQGKAMRNLRFEPSEALRTQARLPAGFAHIGFSTEVMGGFDRLRDVFRSIQMRQLPDPKTLMGLLTASPWLMRAVWWRFIEHRLLFPEKAQFDVHMVSEQEPIRSNRIGLSDNKLDAFGNPLATISWRVSDHDLENSLALTQHFISAWRESRLSHLADIEVWPIESVRQGLVQGGGIYHPGGSIKMGQDTKSGVVDSDLKAFRVPNLSVLSTAVFPTGGGANPTMMLLMAALRLGDKL